MKNFLLTIATVLLIGISIINLWTINAADKITNTYREIKTNYCTLFPIYDRIFPVANYNCTVEGCDSTWSAEEYSRYFYFKDEFLKYCK